MNIQYTHPLSNEKRGQLNNTLFFLYRYIPLQKYTVPKNERNWGIDWARQRDPNALWDTKVRGQVMTHPRPPQFSLSEREQAEASVCVCLCVCVCVCVCGVLLFGFVHVDLQNQAVAALKDKEEKCVCVCVCVCLSRWEPQSMTWHILHGALSKLVFSI